MKLLYSIESARGKTDPELIKKANEYAEDELGWRGYAPWLYVYCAVAGRFSSGWIPDNYFEEVVLPVTKGRYGQLDDLKPLNHRLFGDQSFPDIAYFVNGRFFSIDCTALTDTEIEAILFRYADRVVFKVDGSQQGKGVFVLGRQSFDPRQVRELGNGVFQSYIEQHDSFSELMPASVATLRITTVLNEERSFSARASYLRTGRITDTHVQSESHIRIPIDLRTGSFSELGYLTNWMTTDRHPDTMLAFSGRKIPCFADCISTALTLHRAMPFVQCIGWDMIVDKDNNVKVMEWNGSHNDIKFSEATQGPCFSDLGWERLWRTTTY